MLSFYLDISIISELKWTKITKRHLIYLAKLQSNMSWHNFILDYVIKVEMELIKTWTKQFTVMKNLPNRGIKTHNLILQIYMKVEMELIKTWIKQFIGMKNPPSKEIKMLKIILVSYITMEVESTKI